MLKVKQSRKKIDIIIITRLFILIFILFWLLLSFWPQREIKENAPPCIYTSECEDRLFYIFIRAISKAKKEIHLIVYSLSDQRVIEALNKASGRGVKIKIIYDDKTGVQNLFSLKESIEKVAIKGSALMHRKILIIDRHELYIGSANFTAHSLRLHHNLVIGMKSKKLAERILDTTLPHTSLEIGGQFLEFYTFPEEREMGIGRLLELIEGAKESLVIGMFTWTYKPLTEAIIRAHQRGVKITAILDQQSAYGASKKTMISLVDAGINVRLGPGNKLFHHKFLWVDNETLATGSSNWTNAAFFRNQDCLLILHKLTKRQQKKIALMNKIIRCTTFSSNKEHFTHFS